jgi:hypothetical protein
MEESRRWVYVRTHTLGIVADKIQRKPAAILKR